MSKLVIVSQRPKRFSVEAELVAQYVDCYCRRQGKDHKRRRRQVLSESEIQIEEQKERTRVHRVHGPLPVGQPDQQHRLSRKAQNTERVKLNLCVTAAGGGRGIVF